jgi:hypothetical protein
VITVLPCGAAPEASTLVGRVRRTAADTRRLSALAPSAGERKSSDHLLVQRIWGDHSCAKKSEFLEKSDFLLVVREFRLSCTRAITKDWPYMRETVCGPYCVPAWYQKTEKLTVCCLKTRQQFCWMDNALCSARRDSNCVNGFAR